MNILMIGQGGREHALCWAIARSPLCDKLYCAPASDAIAALATPVALKVDDVTGLVAFSVTNQIDMVVVGPELPLTLGLADLLRQKGIAVMGVSQAAAQLEGSKSFARDFCARHNIPSPAYASFDQLDAALAYLESQAEGPQVIKADGLAAGKGVIVAENKGEALAAAKSLFPLSKKLVIEECLLGQELSFFALCDGKKAVAFGFAQDHKRIGEGDQGENTGGMGAYSPAPLATPALEAQIMDEVVTPLMAGMASENMPYQGVLFCGLMITENGPKVIEFNVRFGDPECQVLMMRLKSDILPLLYAVAKGDLGELTPSWHDGAAMTVVVASKGYPGPVSLSDADAVIGNLPAPAGVSDGPRPLFFHAGTRYDQAKNCWLAAGGRVLNATACGANLHQARDQAYDLIAGLKWQGAQYRRDIGWRALTKE